MPSGTKSALSQHQVAILLKCLIAKRITELMNMTGRTDRTKFNRAHIISRVMEIAETNNDIILYAE